MRSHSFFWEIFPIRTLEWTESGAIERDGGEPTVVDSRYVPKMVGAACKGVVVGGCFFPSSRKDAA